MLPILKNNLRIVLINVLGWFRNFPKSNRAMVINASDAHNQLLQFEEGQGVRNEEDLDSICLSFFRDVEN